MEQCNHRRRIGEADKDQMDGRHVWKGMEYDGSTDQQSQSSKMKTDSPIGLVYD